MKEAPFCDLDDLIEKVASVSRYTDVKTWKAGAYLFSDVVIEPVTWITPEALEVLRE